MFKKIKENVTFETANEFKYECCNYFEEHLRSTPDSYIALCEVKEMRNYHFVYIIEVVNMATVYRYSLCYDIDEKNFYVRVDSAHFKDISERG